ncbi:MAG: pilus assembly protein [Acidobacteria bacterium]|nr:pilus assembly protein [Acidobacteriota bacterium]
MLRTTNQYHQRGQALVLFSLVLAVLLGMMGLMLDVGWAYYVNRHAQTAADAAALAGARKAAELVGAGGSAQCGPLGCQEFAECPGTGNLLAACQYASINGFANTTSSQKKVEVAASDSSHAPGVNSVPVDYWVQVRTQQSLPAWFSGIFGNAGFTPSARATAALRRVNSGASLYLLNRKQDCFASLLNLGVVCGEDFLALGANTLNADGGIYMASSNGDGFGLPQIAAGTVAGSATVNAPFTYILGSGGVQTVIGSASWTPSPTNGFPDGDDFTDPMAGKGQPPAPTGLPDHPVPGGIIVGSLLPGAPTVLPPGNYFATTPSLLGVGGSPTGTPIVVTGNVIFSDGSGCSGFCNYVFYGGLVTGALSSVTFSPGRYVFAGAQPVAGGPGIGLSVGINSRIQDLTPLVGGVATRNSDAGEIFIFTDSNYPGLQLPAALSGISFPQVKAGIATGVNPQITLHGLNRDHSSIPQELKPFAPVLIWQDQNNTTLKYKSDGRLDLSCGGPCSRVLSVPGSQEMVITASQFSGRAGTNLYGTIYGPRGAWTTILGVLPGDTVAGPLQIITGSLQMTLNSQLDLKSLASPPTRLVAALIE